MTDAQTGPAGPAHVAAAVVVPVPEVHADTEDGDNGTNYKVHLKQTQFADGTTEKVVEKVRHDICHDVRSGIAHACHSTKDTIESLPVSLGRLHKRVRQD